jgi:hypothetical protein
MWYVGDLTFRDGVLTPPASWAHVDFAEVEREEPFAWAECETCGATIGAGEATSCDECAA